MASKQKFELSKTLKLGVGRAYAPGQLMKIGSFMLLTASLALGINAIRLYNNKPANSHSPQVLGAIDKAQANDDETSSQLITYKVVKGDTLFMISQKHNISWTTLATLNNLDAPFTLKPGSTLKIPKQ
jgi:LysM repeat protein